MLEEGGGGGSEPEERCTIGRFKNRARRVSRRGFRHNPPPRRINCSRLATRYFAVSPSSDKCRRLLVILLPLFGPPPLRRPFRARCEKFTIVCRGTAIAPLHRPTDDKKLPGNRDRDRGCARIGCGRPRLLCDSDQEL